jgi:alcohol dehydrogenase
MPYVLKANERKITKEIERAAAYLGIKGGFKGFFEWVVKLRKEIGIPHALKDIGIDDKQLERISEMAIKDPTAESNPIAFSQAQYKALARKCVAGTL